MVVFYEALIGLFFFGLFVTPSCPQYTATGEQTAMAAVGCMATRKEIEDGMVAAQSKVRLTYIWIRARKLLIFGERPRVARRSRRALALACLAVASN